MEGKRGVGEEQLTQRKLKNSLEVYLFISALK